MHFAKRDANSPNEPNPIRKLVLFVIGAVIAMYETAEMFQRQRLLFRAAMGYTVSQSDDLESTADIPCHNFYFEVVG